LAEAVIRNGNLNNLELFRDARIFYESVIRKDFWSEKLRRRIVKVIKECCTIFPNRQELKINNKRGRFRKRS
jgi:hypothetical protein